MGHPLAQTIFTSLYIDRILEPCPTSLEQTYFDRSESCEDEPLMHQILRAYCLGLLKTCGYVNQRVKSEHYYEVPLLSFPQYWSLLKFLLGRRLCYTHFQQKSTWKHRPWLNHRAPWRDDRTSDRIQWSTTGSQGCIRLPTWIPRFVSGNCWGSRFENFSGTSQNNVDWFSALTTKPQINHQAREACASFF